MKSGDKALNFSIQSDDGSIFELAKNIGSNVVIYFYPKDDTPGCTLEAQEFSQNLKAFEMHNCLVVGISKDSLDSHCKFRDKYKLGVRLLSDESGEVCDKYGVVVDKNMYGKIYKGIERTTFLIDTKGYVSRVWNKVKVDGHVNEVLDELKKT